MVLVTAALPQPALSAATQPPQTQPSASPELQQQRQLYQQASTALKQGKLKIAEPLIEQLTLYPLYPYLLYQRHLNQIEQLDSTSFNAFSDRFADTPLPNRLYRNWFNHLAKRKRWNTLLENFQPQRATTSQQCIQLWALLQTGAPEQAFNQVASLWVYGSSRPKACDPLFNAWINRGNFNEQHVWDRFWLALERNNSKLARYISKQLKDPQRKRTASQALSLHRKPKQLVQIKPNPNHEGYQQLVLHSLKRLGRTDPALALQQLERFSKPLALSIEQQQQLQRRFGLRLLKRYTPPESEVMEQITLNNNDHELAEWQLRNSILLQDWPTVEQQIEQLASPIRTKDRWRYWLARALKARSEPQAHDRAARLFSELSLNRSFYGFMSADILGNSYRLNHQTKPVDNPTLDQRAQLPGFARARELFHHQQRTEARREWRQASRGFSSQQHYQMAQVAQHWGWYEQAIRSAIAARQWNDLTLRFPLAYSPEIADSAESNDIEETWILAIARQESAFTPDARSHAGAMGLMQLMPSTAKETAKHAKIRYKGAQQLVDPALNLELGSSYLARLSRRYEGNRVLASAAYNAGPYRVNRWLEQRKDLPVDIWIETIPFDETRSYVQNVLSFAVIYSDRLGLPKQLFKPNEQLAALP